MTFALMNAGMNLLRSRHESGGCGSLGCFVFLLMIGAVIYFVMKGRSDRPEQLGAAKRAMASTPLSTHTFACPYAKCASCGASGDKMKQQWDGLRRVTWTCGYCGSPAGVQELKDEELPESARQRLGLSAPSQSMMADQGYASNSSGDAVGGLLTGMMIGTMLGGSQHHQHHDGGGWDGGSGPDGGWGGSGGDSGGDAGGDFGGDSGGDFGGGGDW